MRYIIIIAILFASGVSALADSYDVIKKNGTIRIGVKEDFEPFGFINDKNETVGFDIDIANYIGKKLNLKVKMSKVLSKDRIPKLLDNTFDVVIASMTITDERLKQIDFSKTYFFETQAMLVKKGAKENHYKQFGNKFIGAIQGATSGKNFEKSVAGAKVVYFQEYPQVVAGLKSGLVEGVTTDFSWCFVQEQKNKNDFKVLADPISYEPYGIGVAKGNEPLLKAINDALSACVKDGTYEKIYKKWFNKKPAKLPSVK